MEIYTAILSVMADVGAIGKDKKNARQGFKYRGIDDVMNALQPAMIKHGIFVVPSVLEQKREERRTSKDGNLIYSICTVKYTFYAKDGSSVDAVVIGEGMDSGDKATNKAMSIAFKYACFQVFCIPTEEMKDPDAETPPESKPESTKARSELENYTDATKKLVYKLCGKDKQAAQGYWDKNIAPDANDLDKLKWHYEVISKKLMQMGQ